jgi:hypothetical protein
MSDDKRVQDFSGRSDEIDEARDWVGKYAGKKGKLVAEWSLTVEKLLDNLHSLLAPFSDEERDLICKESAGRVKGKKHEDVFKQLVTVTEGLEATGGEASLTTAYSWICPECGVGNFVGPVRYEFTPGEKERVFREFRELEEWEALPPEWEEFELCRVPDLVKCVECGLNMTTNDGRAGGESEWKEEE